MEKCPIHSLDFSYHFMNSLKPDYITSGLGLNYGLFIILAIGLVILTAISYFGLKHG